jgi:hypothetical protein
VTIRLKTARRGAGMTLATLALLAFSEVALADIPFPSQVPIGVSPPQSAQLQVRHDSLVRQHDVLDREIDAQNSGCSDVAADDQAAVSRCQNSQKRILGEMNAYKASLEQYERALRNLPATAKAVRIGASAAVRDAFIVRSDGKRQPMHSGDPLAAGARVVTGPGGHAQFLLLDETVFTLGPNSDMTMDEFVYDPDTREGTIAVRLAKGVFRFICGQVAHHNPEKMTERLPSGSLGHRGTDYEVDVADDGAVRLKDFKGEIYFVPDSGGPRISLNPGQTVAIDPQGRAGTIQSLR